MPLRHAALQFSDNEQTFFWLVFSSLRVLKGGSRLIYRFFLCHHIPATELLPYGGVGNLREPKASHRSGSALQDMGSDPLLRFIRYGEQCVEVIQTEGGRVTPFARSFLV
jgi:hypothetical protein